MSRLVSVGAVIVTVAVIASCDWDGPVFPGRASVAEMRAELGRYEVAIIPFGENLVLGRPTQEGAVLLQPFPRGSAVTQVWKNGALVALQSSAGTFSGFAMNDPGDVVGLLDSIPAIWKPGASAPTPLLPGQEAFAARLSPWQITNRGEVLLSRESPLIANTMKGVWKNGEFREVSLCRIYALNNQGVILADTCMGLYDTWYLASSPFGATSVNSTKLSGRRCEYPSPHGRVSEGRALNDSNEVLDTDGAWTTPAGCLDFERFVFAFNNRGVLLAYPENYVCTPQSCDIPALVVTLSGSVPLDSLLTPAASAEYTVSGVVGINDLGQITGFVRRRSDAARLAVLFSPIH